MPRTNLEIKVLFCYSPEFLTNTYHNINELEADNQKLCDITQEILKTNVVSHKISLIKVMDFQFATLQKKWGKRYPALSIQDNISLVESPADPSLFNKWKYGSLPKLLVKTKEVLQATIVVLQTVLSDRVTSYNRNPLGVACKIGITQPEETFVVLSRKTKLKGKLTADMSPTILAHEFGHLMGCRHPYGAGFGLDPNLSRSHGHMVRDKNGNAVVGTIMSYASTRILYYSNPTLFAYPNKYQNIPCGVVDESEAYLTVNNNIKKLAGVFTS